jgi:aspartate racemase
MGPEATNRLCALITALTPAAQDQDHIPVIAFNNSLIPNRVGAISGAGESCVAEMIRTAQVLERAGADFLLMPCNLAHYFREKVQREIRVPILDMIEETVSFVVAQYPNVYNVGLLASTPTIENGLYEKSLARYGRVVLTPAASEQQSKVMEAIYGQRGIKSGYKRGPGALLMEAARSLVTSGAELIIAGCTEVSLVSGKGRRAPCPIVDPMAVLARVAIERARAGSGKLKLGEDSEAVRASDDLRAYSAVPRGG